MIVLLFTLLSFSLLAAPQNLEVWFIAQDKKTVLHQEIDEKILISRPMVSRPCEPVGDYCFDPQYGLYKPDNEWQAVSIDKESESSSPQVLQGFDRDLINCDQKNGFDIFCGKASSEKVIKQDLEVWIDTSGSMREFDFTDEHGGCYRKSFITRLDAQCPFTKKLNVMMFDTSIKQIGNFDSLCLNQGLNSTKRMMDWIERSEVKTLIMITDINEYTKEFADFLLLKGAKLKGEKGDFHSRSLLGEVSTLVRACK